jgi:hypothetical protein
VGRIVALIVAVAVFIVGALLWLAPATLLPLRLEQATRSSVTLADAGGSVWNGHGTLVAGGIGVPLAWALDPWPLVRGELRLRLAPPAGSAAAAPRGRIVWRDGRLALTDVEFDVPAAWLVGAGGVRLPWQLRGDVAVAAGALDWSPAVASGDIGIEWKRARIDTGTDSVDLGDVTLTLRGSGDTLAGPVANRGGDLDVQGSATLRGGAEAAVSLLLTPRRADDGGLARALAGIGTAEGGGRRVVWRAPLR